MPQKAWSRKDERKYEHIVESAREQGASKGRAKEIAARTVNRDRRLERRTKSGKTTTEGTGKPTSSLEERTRQELYNRARELHVEGRSRMSKGQLVRAIRARG